MLILRNCIFFKKLAYFFYNTGLIIRSLVNYLWDVKIRVTRAHLSNTFYGLLHSGSVSMMTSAAAPSIKGSPAL